MMAQSTGICTADQQSPSTAIRNSPHGSDLNGQKVTNEVSLYERRRYFSNSAARHCSNDSMVRATDIAIDLDCAGAHDLPSLSPARWLNAREFLLPLRRSAWQIALRANDSYQEMARHMVSLLTRSIDEPTLSGQWPRWQWTATK